MEYSSRIQSNLDGGEGEIRTPGSLSATSAFEAGAFNHSATSPYQWDLFSLTG